MSSVIPEIPSTHRPRISLARTVDLDAAREAAGDLLAALGVPLDSPDRMDTPRRMVEAYAEMLAAPAFDFTTFPNTAGYDGLVVVDRIPVRSLCEHHMLPFSGVATVGYLPGDRVLGLSKLARVVDFYARQPQTQERLTTQVAEHLERHLAPRGVGVHVTAEHSCMTARGARAERARTVTATLLGQLHDDDTSRAEFLALAGGRHDG